MWSASVKAKVIKLRKQGYSYGQLVKEFGISKSTLFGWIGPLKRVGFTTPQDKIRWAKTIQPLAVKAIKEKRQQRLRDMEERIEKELSNSSIDIFHKKTILAMLYWAEGNKGRFDSLTIANTDSQLLLLFITLLRSCYSLSEKKFRLRIHLHDYHHEEKIKSYWSELLSIPLNQFEKTHWKLRSLNKHYRENSHGICFLRYHDIYLKEELVRLALAISGKITSGK